MGSVCPSIFPIIAAAALAVALPASAQTLKLRPREKPKSAHSAVSPQSPAAKAGPTHLVLPKGTSLQVEVPHQYPMKDGEALEGKLIFPIYASGQLAVLKDTVLYGKVINLAPDRKMRWRARLMGDFTPYHKAEVQFDSIDLQGKLLPISTAAASTGAPVVQLNAAGVQKHHGFIRRQFAQAKNQLMASINWWRPKGLGGRARQMLYNQLPYHPEEIAAHTAWSFELSDPLTLPGKAAQVVDPAPAAAIKGKPEMWTVNALLTQGLTSAHAHPGDPVDAMVVQPVYNREKQLVVPEGATLIGRVTLAKPARSFGRNGKLRFMFQQVRFPAGFGTAVQGSLSGASATKTQDLQINAEGTVTPRNKSSLVGPLLLTMLAGKGLDQDGGVAANTAHAGVAANGLGLIGRVVGTAAGSPSLAAGIGFYAAGLSVYDNFLRTGRDVVFPKDTRIEIQTTPLRAPVLKQ